MKPTLSKKLLSTTMLTAAGIVAFGGYAKADYAAPTDGTVVAGSSSTIQTGSHFDTTQTTDRATTEYYKPLFLGSDQSWHIQTPGSSSISAHLVKASSGADPTQILGFLSSNGRVIIVDYNGVFFGAGSRVDVAGLVTSTGNVAVGDIMDGDDKFEFADFGDGKIELNGTISVADAGIAAFVSPFVSNNGIINAKVGKVAFAAGEKVTLDLYGDELIEIAVDGEAGDALLKNAGTINAEGGQVVMTARAAKEAVDDVINVSGVINASSATVVGGKIVLGGGDKGKVTVSGKLDASGKNGGGAVAVKGQNVEVTETGVIAADAKGTGNGGKVDVIANGVAIFRGNILARGGEISGDGGVAEVSGYQGLDYQGLADLTASNGALGTLLLDPRFTIIHSGLFLPGILQNYILSYATLANQLKVANVTLQADEFIDVGTSKSNYNIQNITGNANIDAAINAGLDLLTDGDIDVSQWQTLFKSGTTAGTLTLQSDTVNFNRNLTMGNGGIKVDAGTLNLDSQIKGLVNGQAVLLGDDRIVGTGKIGTINIKSPSALIQQGVSFADDAQVNTLIKISAGSFNEDVDLNKSNITVEGANKGIAGTGVRVAETEIKSLASTDQSNVIVDGVKVYGGIKLDGAIDHKYQNNIISHKAGHGIDGIDLNGILIGLNKFADVSGNGLNIINSHKIDIKNNEFKVDGIGTYVDPSSLIVLSGNNYVGGTDGVVFEDTDDVEISNNTVTGVSGDGIRVVNGNRIEILDNTINSAGTDGYTNISDASKGDNGIETQGGSDINIKRNTVKLASRGIASFGGSNITVGGAEGDGNTVGTGVRNDLRSGIFASEGVDGWTVSYNTVNGVRNDGISIERGVSTVSGSNASIQYNKIQNVGTSATLSFMEGILVSHVGGKVDVTGNVIKDTLGTGIEVVSTEGAIIEDNDVRQAGFDGINVKDSKSAQIIGNQVGINGLASITGNGIALIDSESANISGNNVANASLNGIYVDPSHFTKVIGNDITNVDEDGIHVIDSNGVLIEDNDIFATAFIFGSGEPGATKNGIYVSNAETVTINNNRITGDATFLSLGAPGAFENGIHVNNVESSFITNNKVKGDRAFLGLAADGAYEHGIYVHDGVNTLITGNDIYLAGIDGIHVSDMGAWGHDGDYAVEIKNNKVDFTGDDGIEVRDSAATLIEGNNVSHSGWNYGLLGDGSEFGGDESGADGIHVENVHAASSIIIVDAKSSFFGGYGGGSDNVVVIKKNTVNDTKDDGIEVWDSGKTLIAENKVTNAGVHDGVYLGRGDYNGADGIHVGGVWIDEEYDPEYEYTTFGFGGFGGNEYAVTIKDNDVNNTGDDGIEVQYSESVKIKGNDVKNAGFEGFDDGFGDDGYGGDLLGADGIHVAYVGNSAPLFAKTEGFFGGFGDNDNVVLIEKNTVDTTGDDGIEVYNAGKTTISYNKVDNAGVDPGTHWYDDPEYQGHGDFYGADGISVISVSNGDYGFPSGKGFGFGGFGDDDYAVNILHNTVNQTGDDEIEVWYSGATDISWNKITNAGTDGNCEVGYGGDQYGADGISVYSVYKENNYGKLPFTKGFGGFGDDDYAVHIDHNTIKTTGDDGIEVTWAGKTLISNNDISYAGVEKGWFGFEFYGEHGDSTGADGIHVQYVDDDSNHMLAKGFGGFGDSDFALTIFGNTIHETGDDGIDVQDVDNVLIKRNNISENGIHGGADYYGGDGIHVQDVNQSYAELAKSFGDGFGYGYGDESDEYKVVVRDNTIEETADDGVEIVDVDGRVLVKKNTITDVGYKEPWDFFQNFHPADGYGADGIHVRNVYNEHDKYDLVGESEYGFYGYAVDVLNNTIDQTGDDGVEVIWSSSTLIDGNTISNVGITHPNKYDDYKSFGYGEHESFSDYYGADGIHVRGVSGDEGYGTVGTVGDDYEFTSYSVVVRNNTVTETLDDGIEVVDSGRTLISTNNVSYAGYQFPWSFFTGDAPDGWGADGIHVRNVYAENDGYEGPSEGDYYGTYESFGPYAGDGNYDVEVIGNTVYKSADDGIEVTYQGDIRQALIESYCEPEQLASVAVIGNDVDKQGDDGIDITNANFVYVATNEVTRSGGDGIIVNREGSDWASEGDEYPYSYYNYIQNDVLITGNTVDDSGDDGIEVEGYGEIEIGNNIVTDSGDDGIIVTRLLLGGYYEEEPDYEVALYSYGDYDYYGYGTANVNIHDNQVDNSGEDGIQVDAFFYDYYKTESGFGPVNLWVTNNTVTDSGLDDYTGDEYYEPEQSNGLFVHGPQHGYVYVAGNTFERNPVGARFESGLIDLTGPGNSFIDGDIGMLFSPYQTYSEYSLLPSWFYAPLALVDDDAPGYETFPTTAIPSNFGGTIGEQFFSGQTTAFVKLENQAFLDPYTNEAIWLNGLNSTYVTPFGTVRPSDTGGFVTQDVFDFLESRFIHWPDTLSTGIFWFGIVPDDADIAQEDILNRFNVYNGHNSQLNITLLGLPSIPGAGNQGPGNFNPATLNAIETFAGGQSDGTVSPDELNAIEAAAGGEGGQGPAAVNCWGDAVDQAYNGATVNYSYGTTSEETVAGAASCSAPTSF